jgi:uncharacterized ParB-like nuclease family protein
MEGYQNPASGFLVWHDGAHFLVTNWHCLAARNAFTGKSLNKTLAFPSHVVVDLRHLGIGDLTPRPLHGKTYDANDEEREALWLEHPDRDEEVADIAALPLSGLPEDTPALFKPCFADEHRDRQLDLPVGEDVFVVGFPRAIGNGSWPVWKRASLATEPSQTLNLATDERQRQLRAVLVDGAVMEGLSGSLVIQRSANPGIMMDAGPTNVVWPHLDGRPFYYSFVGVYSGRALDGEGSRRTSCAVSERADKAVAGQSDEDDLARARLGIVWRAELLMEILKKGTRGLG